MARKTSLKEMREDKGFSFEKVASDVGVSTQTVKNWENGNVHPSQMSFENATKLAECYEISINWLWHVVSITPYAS